MSRGLNKVMIIGNLGRDPEMRYTPSGRPVTTFTVACSRAWTTPDGERHEETEWFNVVSWGKLAETCKQYLVKGSHVYVDGRLQTRSWDDPEGKRHSRTEAGRQRNDHPRQPQQSFSLQRATDDDHSGTTTTGAR